MGIIMHERWRSSAESASVGAVQRAGQRLAVIAAERGDQDALAIGEAGHVRVGDHVVGVLVVADGADKVADVEQVGGGFQQFAAGRGEPVQRLERGEQQVGNVGHLAGVLERDAVAAAHVLHLAALVAVEAGEFGADVARGQVGDDAVAHAGARVVDGGEVELLQELEQHGSCRAR